MSYFNIDKIKYEGKDSVNPYAFKYYNPEEIVYGKTMKEYMRFALSWWHTLCSEGSDIFGSATANRKWNRISDPLLKAKAKVDAGFELMEKLSIGYFCFHDRDLVDEQETLEETNKLLDEVSDYMLLKMKETGIKCLWGTANCFNHPRYVSGAATSPNADAFAYAAAQIKKAMDITKNLGGTNYVFWGGREGYDTLLNTDLERELNHYAYMLKLAVDYKKKIGFEGQLLIEPKPKEPTKHQYDFDTQTVLGFLRKYNLENDFKMNIEANHATLAMHTFQHELAFARVNNVFGSIDANQGDMLLGWDTDQFPTNLYDTTLAMIEVIKAGGFTTGGLNFDAKVRRASFTDEDLFLAYIAGMDSFAKGLKVAMAICNDGYYEDFIAERYASYNEGIGKKIDEENTSFEELSEYAMKHDKVKNTSGRQELLEAVFNSYLLK